MSLAEAEAEAERKKEERIVGVGGEKYGRERGTERIFRLRFVGKALEREGREGARKAAMNYRITL
jgi:hypothetical protein